MTDSSALEAGRGDQHGLALSEEDKARMSAIKKADVDIDGHLCEIERQVGTLGLIADAMNTEASVFLATSVRSRSAFLYPALAFLLFLSICECLCLRLRLYLVISIGCVNRIYSSCLLCSR